MIAARLPTKELIDLHDIAHDEVRQYLEVELSWSRSQGATHAWA